MLLKNLYNQEYISLLCSSLNMSELDEENFVKNIFNSQWKNKELKERMRHITTTLYDFLPHKYKDAIEILKLGFSKLNHSYSLENIIFQDYVEVFGLDEFEISMDALEYFTNKSSSEFAIRQFILKHTDDTIAQMHIWADSDNHHVRRLASEGCRPRLPWAIALNEFKKNPSEILLILEKLKDDKSEYVRKSVANNINDISKDNPEIVKDLANSWIGHNKNRDSLLKHGCRTLLKAGDKESLSLFGFNKPDLLELKNFKISSSVEMGKELEFSFLLNSKNKLGKLRIEYAISFLRKNGTHNKKVFKVSEGIFTENKRLISKKHSFRPISTRVYYKGQHKLAIIINGVIFAEKEFILS
ncbi:MAG: 3-methyladenine DNA glycosylase AlkC [Sulfurimonas sp.]|jgi:3-methyladenine DNA glycosylase AlkC